MGGSPPVQMLPAAEIMLHIQSSTCAPDSFDVPPEDVSTPDQANYK
jgi:hypothetical protein